MEFDITGQLYFGGQNFRYVEKLFILFGVTVIFLDHFITTCVKSVKFSFYI